MRVAYFANQFADAQGHGLARYSRELYHALTRLPEMDVVPVAGWSSLPPADLATLQTETGLQLTGLGRRGTSLLWTFLNRPSLESRVRPPVDVVHSVAMGYPVATRKPLVVTIHDLGPLTHPQFFRNTRPWVMQRSLDQAVGQADAIVCVSQSTADEVRDYVGAKVDGRLHVVLEGVDDRFFDTADKNLLNGLAVPPDGVPFILSAGAISPRKNVLGLLRAMSHVLTEIPHHLVLVGGAGWDSEELREVLADQRLKARVHFAGFVSDDELRALYQAASVYVHPSLYEGFGLPVLEAMASGTPVIVSNRSSLPEVAGDAGHLTNAADPQELAADIVKVCNATELQTSLSLAGQKRAREFQWSKTAQSMQKIYSDVQR
jgi:glycosyltransferase involved in cell wall biosynthesis